MKKSLLTTFITVIFSFYGIAQKKTTFTQFEIDSVANVKKEVNEKSARFIKRRLNALISRSVREKCNQLGVKYPPRFVLFRAFKLEKEFEIWMANKREDC